VVKRIIRQVIKSVRKANRRNRVLYVVVVGEEAILVKPDFYKEHANSQLVEADQLRFREKPLNAARRLGAFILPGINAEYGYLRNYPIKGGPGYTNRYVVFALCSGEIELPIELAPFKVPLAVVIDRGESSQSKLAQQIQDDLREYLANHPSVILQQVLRRYKGTSV